MSNQRPKRDSMSIEEATASSNRLRIVTRLLLTSFAIFLFPYLCFADFTGRVVSVLDGDTLEVLHNQHPVRIRLSGIDCPEKGQAYGKRAKQAKRFY